LDIPAPAFIAQRISTTPSTAYLGNLPSSNPPGFGNPAEERLFSNYLVPPSTRPARTLIMPALPSPAQLTSGAHLSPAALLSVTRHHSCRATPFLCPLSIASSPCPAQLTSGAQPGPVSQPLPAASLFSHFVDPPAYVLLVTTAAQSRLTQRSLPQEPNAVLSPSLRQPCQAKPYSHCLQHQLTYLWQLSHLSRTHPVQCC